MHVPEYMTFADGLCRFRPRGIVSLVDGVALITSAIALCCAKGGTKILVDVTGLSGYTVPTLADRFWMAQDWAHAAQGRLILAVVALPEYIDPKKFGVRAAADAGLKGDVFTDTAAAEAWLKANEPDAAGRSTG